MKKKCKNCGYIGEADIKGSGWIELFLYLFYLIPGIFYSIWRRSGEAHICPKCRAPHMITVKK